MRNLLQLPLFFFFILLSFIAVIDSKRVLITGQKIINCRAFNLQSQKSFEFLGSYKSEQSIPTFSLPEIAFVGRSNVGKSSLLNCLTGLNKKVAVESKTPGRTQSINTFKCSDKDGDICIFVDLPGYGFAKLAKTQQEEVSRFLRDYLRNRSPLRLVILLVDIRREIQDLDLQMLQFLQNEGLPYLIVATKADKMSAKEVSQAVGNMGQAFNIWPKFPIPFSSITGIGRRDVWTSIKGGILGDGSVLSGSLDQDDDDEEEEGDEGDGEYEEGEDPMDDGPSVYR